MKIRKVRISSHLKGSIGIPMHFVKRRRKRTKEEIARYKKLNKNKVQPFRKFKDLSYQEKMYCRFGKEKGDLK